MSQRADVIAFDNSYARLPDRFYARVMPTPVAQPRLIRANGALAEELGIDAGWLASSDGVAMLAGNRLPDGAAPLAAAYAGHQFGNFVPQLGDGRAILIGEVRDRAGARRDVQLKGAGRTPFSRMGDGRAALGPVLREYIVSEAFAALGIPTTRALAAVTTGEDVMRETPLPGAVIARVAASHVRVGTFQFFAARGDTEAVRLLADFVIDRHYPALAGAEDRYGKLLEAIVARHARLTADWLLIGFIHGVMNTDNCSIAGETIDFGPCAFMDHYRPGAVYSSIDRQGRYAYANQPRIAQWNMARLAETMLPLLDSSEDAAVEMAQVIVGRFSDLFRDAYTAGLRRKIGLSDAAPDDLDLAHALLEIMAEQEADFTLVFRHLADAALGRQHAAGLEGQFSDPAKLGPWLEQWWQRLAQESRTAAEVRDAMRATNPVFIPRNHLIEEVIEAAVARADFAPFDRLVDVSGRPFEDRADSADLAVPPLPHEVVAQTFCGT